MPTRSVERDAPLAQPDTEEPQMAFPPAVRIIVSIAALLSVFIAVWMMFGVGSWLRLYVPLENEYLFALLGLLLPLVFLIRDLRGAVRAGAVPLYDYAAALLAFAIALSFALKSNAILFEGWVYLAPPYAKILSLVMWVLVLEGLRRSSGLVIFVICALFSLYPVFSDFAPGILRAQATAIDITAGFYIFSSEGILGVPFGAFATLVIGFLIFGVALQYTGGGAFFLNLAFALLGTRRGGPAKVAIFSSGLMGSVSGSVITNVLLMPPVMGATAFVMATFVEIPYSEIVIAAAIPSLLYYLALFMQIDGYAARHDIKGLPDKELPGLRAVFRDGWYFVAVFVLLIVMLLYFKREAQAPFYASLLLILINQFSRRHRWDWTKLRAFAEAVGVMLAELAALLAGVGLIIGALTLSGKVGTIAYELVALAGGNVIVLLLVGALTSFVLGMGMTVTAAYIFLAVTLAPALTGAGLDRLAVHLFMLYWGMVSFITPPVALGAFAAASIARANPISTGFEAMRLGSIIYFLPFFFVLNPARIGRGSPEQVLIVIATAMFGIWLISGGLQGYLIGVGDLGRRPVASMAARAAIILAGMAFALPGGGVLGISQLWLLVIGAGLLAVTFGLVVTGRAAWPPIAFGAASRMRRETRTVKTRRAPEDGFTTLSVPTHRGSTIVFDTYEDFAQRGTRPRSSYTYGLSGTPTTRTLQNKLTALEGAYDTFLTPSGLMAITATVLSICQTGDSVLIPDNVYPPVRRFAETTLARLGISARYYDPRNPGEAGEYGDGVKLVWVESPGSTTMEIADLAVMRTLADRLGALLGCDNSWATPLLCRPLEQGADIVVEALTKYLTGHSDLLMGSVSVRSEDLAARIDRGLRSLGVGVSPDDCFLALRGIETAAVRVAHVGASALWLADRMADLALVEEVLHPAMPAFRDHALWRKQFSGASGLFSLVLKVEDKRRFAERFNRLSIFRIGASWGGTQSLLAPVFLDKERSVVRTYTGLPIVRSQHRPGSKERPAR